MIIFVHINVILSVYVYVTNPALSPHVYVHMLTCTCFLMCTSSMFPHLCLPQNAMDEEDLAGDLKRITFASTPVMSSYLLAFIVGEFDYVEERDSNGVLVRVYTPLGKAEHGAFSLDVRLE